MLSFACYTYCAAEMHYRKFISLDKFISRQIHVARRQDYFQILFITNIGKLNMRIKVLPAPFQHIVSEFGLVFRSSIPFTTTCGTSKEENRR
jgi:hypothetical protein